MSEIIPAILAESKEDLVSKLFLLPKEIKIVHLDVLEDDYWTDDIRVEFEAHLMVKEPEKIVDRWVKRGAKRIIIHKLPDVKATNFEVGLGVELDIPLPEVSSLIPRCDFIHLMSIAEIGEQGHPLDQRIFAKIKEVKEKFPSLTISVDGGINVSNFQMLEALGVDRLVVGSGFKDLWKSLTKK